MQDFQKLKVWQKAHALAIDVYRMSETFPRRDALSITAQMRRASLSVPTNIAEGAGKASATEFRRYLEIALGSASETGYHLLVARDIGLLDTEQYDRLSERAVEIRRMLVGLRKRIASATAPDAPRSSTRAGD